MSLMFIESLGNWIGEEWYFPRKIEFSVEGGVCFGGFAFRTSVGAFF